MIPFQLSPVETWKSVRKAMPKFSKVACRLMPSHGFSSLQTDRRERLSRPPARPPALPAGLSSETRPQPSEVHADGTQPWMEKLRLREVAHRLGLRLR